MAENNEYKESLEKTIDTLFTDKPSAPVSIKKAESAVRVAPKPTAVPTVKPEEKAEVKAEAKPEEKAEAKPEVKPEVKAEANPEAKPEVKKNVPTAKAPVRAKKEPKPVEKESVWVHIMTVCALITCLSIAGVAVIACFFYFGPGSPAAAGKPMVAYFSMIMCIIACAVLVGLTMGVVFVLRKIEKDIREIKSKL